MKQEDETRLTADLTYLIYKICADMYNRDEIDSTVIRRSLASSSLSLLYGLANEDSEAFLREVEKFITLLRETSQRFINQQQN